jgi:hypothetical protein
MHQKKSFSSTISSTVMTKFILRSSHRAALFCVIVMLRFISGSPVFLASPPPPPLLLFALNLPCRLAAVANALFGMVNSELLRLLLVLLGQTPFEISRDERYLQAS